MDIEFLAAKAKWVRQTVMRMAYRANSGHLSTAFSQADLLVSLYYGGILHHNYKEPKWPGRDRFILSKGQGGIGLYPILADVGYFPKDELLRFAQLGSILGVHAEWNIPGVEIITGSLGHGLPVAVGMALAAKQDNKNHNVFCMLGDGELYEGSNWEAMFSAAHHKLNNLVVIVDLNGGATIGHLEKYGANDGPNQNYIAEKFRSFGFAVQAADGHDFRSIDDVLCDWRYQCAYSPRCVIAHTIKGKGIKAMEDGSFFPTHYRLPKGDDLKAALKDLDMDEKEFKAEVGESVGY